MQLFSEICMEVNLKTKTPHFCMHYDLLHPSYTTLVTGLCIQFGPPFKVSEK